MIPWSKKAETRARWMVRISWTTLIFHITGILVGVVARIPPLMVWCALMGIVALVFRSIWRDALAEILRNKPAGGGKGMTRWTWHSHGISKFQCGCGQQHTFEGKPFQENAVDAGGGRYAFVCPCGRGHYKFKSQPRLVAR